MYYTYTWLYLPTEADDQFKDAIVSHENILYLCEIEISVEQTAKA